MGNLLELWRVNIDVIEAWYHITIEKAETVGSVGFELRIVAVDSVVLGLIWEFGGQGKDKKIKRRPDSIL